MVGFRVVITLQILLPTITFSDSPDNAGREFLIAFMNNEDSQFDFKCFPVDIYISTPKKTQVNVTISAPRFTGTKEYHQISLTYGQLKNVQLNCKIRVFGSRVEQKAVYIIATEEIVVYTINRQPDSTDGYLAFPIDVLGTRHFVVTYCVHGNTKYLNNIVIAAPDDNTGVEIKLADNVGISVRLDGHTYRRRNVIKRILKQYDVLQIETLGDLTGSRVQSNKPITVLSGNKKSAVHLTHDNWGIDHLVEQIPPTETWGTRFVTVRIPYRTREQILRIVAAEDGTLVTMTSCGSRFTYRLAMGQWKQHVMKSSCYAYITSNKGILVMQFTQSFSPKEVNKQKSDPSMFTIPPIGQYAADYVIGAPTGNKGLFDNYYLIVMKKSDKNGLLVDGKRPNWLDVHGIDNTDLIGGYIYVGTGIRTHTLRHQSQISIFGVVAYGARHYESYAFPVGMRLAPINKACHLSSMVIADGIDNDCDGLIDEEICYSDTTDDDGDNRIDEDCARLNKGVTIPHPSTAKSTTTTAMTSSTTTTTTRRTVTLTTTIAMASEIVTVEPTTLDSSAPKLMQKFPTVKTMATKTLGSYLTFTFSKLSPNLSRWTIVTSQVNNRYPVKKKYFYKIHVDFKRPYWLRIVELVIIVCVIVIITGFVPCCCRHFCCLMLRRNTGDEQHKHMVLYTKKRPLPQPRRRQVQLNKLL